MNDCLTPWQAIENAAELAWELGTPSFVKPRLIGHFDRKPSCNHVHFEESVQIQFYQDDVKGITTMAHDTLQSWKDKPWKLHPTSYVNFDSHEDYVSLMQQPLPSRSPALVKIRVVGLHHFAELIEVDATFDLATQLEHLWPSMDISELHPVPHPPSFNNEAPQQMVIAQMRNDDHQQHPRHQDDVLILVTLTQDEPSRYEQLNVHWSPSHVTRQGLLVLLQLRNFCEQADVLCWMFLNHRLMPLDGHGAYEVANGDHVRIQIRSARHSVCHYLVVSPSQSEHGQEDDDAATSPLSPYTVRSRSRERNEFGYEPYDSPSLLQLHVQLSQHQEEQHHIEQSDKDVNDGGRLVLCLDSLIGPSASSPHVLDRWCDEEVDGLIAAKRLATPVHGNPSYIAEPEANPSESMVQSVNVDLPGLPLFLEKLMALKGQLCQWIPPQQHLATDHKLLFDQWQQAFELGLRHSQDTPESLCIYTDGSKLWNEQIIEESSGWAFVVTAKWPHSDEWGIIGHSLGATTHQSFQSETEALVRALLWMCQEPLIQAGVPCKIVSDATSALFALDGSFSMRHVNFVHLVRPLYRFVEGLTPLTLQWEKAHAGQVFNELADHLARSAAYNVPLAYAESIVHPIKDQQFLAWLWLCGDARCRYPELPPVHDQGFDLPVPLPMQCFDFVPKNADIHGQLALDFQFLSCNVNSFKDPSCKDQISWTGRAELIRQQAIEFQAHCLAWQETRRRFEGIWTSQHFVGLEAAAHSGKGGVALWFRHDLPFAHLVTPDSSQPLYFQAKNFTVLLSHHELLVVKYKSDEWKAIFVSGHAPNDVSESAVKDGFWKMTHDTLAPFADWPIFLGLDANARVGHDPHLGIGTFSGDLPNDNGYRFIDFVSTHHLCLPSTFECYAVMPRDDQGTWLSKGGWKRIDFIAFPIEWLEKAQFATWTISIEKDVAKDDHKAVCVRCRICTPIRNPNVSTAPHLRLNVDSHSMLTDVGKLLCKDILNQMIASHPGFQAPADVQAAYMHTFAHQQLQQQFPPKPRTQKPSWISDSTWATIGQTRQVKRKLHQLKATWTSGLLREVFLAWKQPACVRPSCVRWIKQHDVETACALAELTRIRHLRTNSLRVDEATYLTQCANHSFAELNEAKGTELWKKLRHTLPKYRRRKKKPLPMADTHASFLTHFAAIEDAQIQTPQNLRHSSVEHSESALAKAITMQVSSLEIPSIFELEDAIRELQVGRSSIGNLPAEFLKADPAASATLLFPSLLALFRFFQQPISWKGGQYFPLYKGKGAITSPGNYRAILIGNTVPKIFHKILRKRLARCVEPSLLPFQIGGLPRMSVHFAAHFLSTLRQRAHDNRRPNAVIFFDLKSAFYRAQRSTIVQDILGYQEDCLDEDITLDVLQQPDALTSMNVPISLRAVLQEVFSGTWNTVISHQNDASNSIMRSVRGTRPGDPVADLAFTCAMRQILRDFVHDAHAFLPVLAPDDPTKIPPITWVDDVAVFLEAETSAQVLDQARTVVRVMAAKCRSYGLDINFSPGKSEALFHFHGREAATLRAKLYVDKGLQLGEGCWSDFQVPVASRYTHLGVIHSANLSFDAELQYRLARGREALRECRKTVLTNQAIPISRRWALASSLILSRVFFACEIWPELSTSQHARVRSFVVKIARTILGKLNFAETPHTCDDEVIAQIPVPDLDTLLRAARLRYVARLWKHAPCHLRRLLHNVDVTAEFSWLARIRADFQWLQERSNRVKHFPDPMVDDARWWDLVQNSEWHALVTRVCEADTVYNHYMARYRVWRIKFRTAMQEVGMSFHQTPLPSTQHSVGDFQCSQCERCFTTARARSVHEYKVHGNHADVRHYISSTVCGSCLKDFHSMQRLRQHLQYKQDEDKCLRHLQSVWWPHAPIDLQRKPELQTAHRLPAIRMPGPLLPSRIDWMETKPEKQMPPTYEDMEQPNFEDLGNLSQTHQAQIGLDQPPRINQELLQELIAYVMTSPCPFVPPQWQSLFQASNFQTIVQFGTLLQEEYIDTLDPQIYAEVHPWFEELLAMHFRLEHDNVCPAEPLLSNRQKKQVRNPVESKTPQMPWIQDQERDFTAPTSSTVPRLASFGATYYILYAYSGHRRSGDILEWMDHFRTALDVHIQVLTIDIVYDAALCDLRSQSAQVLWLDLVRRGRFVGLIGAPPCETWSAARFRAWMIDGDHGPAPLRLAVTPWGRVANSLTGQRQVLCANDLLQIWYLFMAYAISTGTAFLMEHPAKSKHISCAPSVWKLPETKWLLSIPGVREHLVHQGWFGALSSKPTTFLTYNLQSFPECLDGWWDRTVNPHSWIKLVGTDESGQYWTAQAKAYPSRLNAAIAESFVKRVQTLECNEHTERVAISEDFVQVIRPVVTAPQAFEMGPDYAPAK